MGKSDHIIFEAQQIAEDDWQICAHCPSGQIQYITGFLSEGEATEWIAGGRSKAWARSWSQQHHGSP
jgi:hypothetical protein